MGNASVINASCYKKNSVTTDDATDVVNLSEQMTESTVIQNDLHQKKQSKDPKTKKSGLVKSANSNRSSFRDNAKV